MMYVFLEKTIQYFQITYLPYLKNLVADFKTQDIFKEFI